MSLGDPIPSLREELDAARRKGKHREVLRILEQLAEREPNEARWPHQRGEALRRMGDIAAAIGAFEVAADLSAREGFVARAVATAKMVAMLDPARTDVLDRVDPSSAKRAHREHRPGSVSASADEGRRPSLVNVTELRVDRSAPDDEVRFIEDEAAEEEVELDISEVELLELAPDDAGVDRLALMPSFPLFAELPREVLARLAHGADLVELPPGTLVIRRGEVADALYCIVEGAVAVRVPELFEFPTLGEGSVFGESCLLAQGTRQADVLVRDPLVALRIDRALLEQVARDAPQLEAVLFELLARRLVANVVRTSPLFTAFGPEDRLALARRFSLRRAPPGLVLIEQGKRSDALYLLAQGTATEVDASGRARDRGPGAVLGAEGLIEPNPAAVTVTARTECVLLRLPRERFAAVAAAYPPALEYLTEASRKVGFAGRALS